MYHPAHMDEGASNTTRDLGRLSAMSIGAVAVVAYALCDMIHEVLGHGVAVLASPKVTALSLTTVALSTSQSSRLVAAAGTIANLVIGITALTFAHRARFSKSARYFLWLLGSLNLFNATGYLLYSGALGTGDWAVVIAGLEPGAVWRGTMALVGGALYALSVAASAAVMRGFVNEGSIRATDVSRLTRVSYVVGGILLVLGSIPNPVSRSLILTSGVSSGFGAMIGLLGVPRLVPAVDARPEAREVLRIGRWWTAAALLVAAVFVLVIGPGIRF